MNIMHCALWIERYVYNYEWTEIHGKLCMGGCKKSGESEQITTASCQSGSGFNSGSKRRYCEIGDRETGGQPSKARKYNLLPWITKQ